MTLFFNQAIAVALRWSMSTFALAGRGPRVCYRRSAKRRTIIPSNRRVRCQSVRCLLNARCGRRLLLATSLAAVLRPPRSAYQIWGP